MRVPERMVNYVSGSVKKTRDGKLNSMRTARDADSSEAKKKKKKKAKKTRAMKSKNGSPSSRLSQLDQEELLRACKKGYLTLDGRKAGHCSLAILCSSDALRGSKMAMAHRDWCDERSKPNIILYKASGRHSREVLDYVIVDLSPLRDQVSSEWTAQILNAASSAGMELRKAEDTEECSTDSLESPAVSDQVQFGDDKSSQVRPHISCLPFVSMGFFVGDRSNAKAMAKELSQLWDLPELVEENEAGEEDYHVNRNGRYQNSPGKTGRKDTSKPGDTQRARRRRIKKDDWEQHIGRYLRY